MSDKNKNFASSKNLVPVHSLIPEQRPGEGAVLVMRDGSFRVIVKSGAVNFDMKSQTERAGLTYAFGALVNSLEPDFPVEIVSHSKMLDIDAYVRQFEGRMQNTRTPEAIRQLIQDHKVHFEQTVKTNKLLQREIYVVVPWKGVRGPVQRGVLDDVPLAPLFRAFSRKAEAMSVDKKPPTDLEIAAAKQQLEVRTDQVIVRLAQMGVNGRRLNEDEVRKLLYEIYHSSLAERQKSPGRDSEGMIQGFSADGLSEEQRRRIASGRPSFS